MYSIENSYYNVFHKGELLQCIQQRRVITIHQKESYYNTLEGELLQYIKMRVITIHQKESYYNTLEEEYNLSKPSSLQVKEHAAPL